MSLLTTSGFRRGDQIEVTPLPHLLHGNGDFGAVRGTALTHLEFGGGAEFGIEVLMGDKRERLRLDVNSVNVRLLFSARIARGGDK